MDQAVSFTPKLSVIIVPFVGIEGLNTCLDALSSQSTGHTLEIIVPYDDKFKNFDDLDQSKSDIRLVYRAGNKTYAQLRAIGVLAARGEFVVVTEDHCRPATDWCENIITAHETLNPVGVSIGAIGGPIEKDVPDTIINWAMYFADYVRYAPPIAEGPVNSLTDLNVSYRKADLVRHVSIWESEFHENAVHHAFVSNGQVLWLSPSIVVFQKRPYSFKKALYDRYAFGRLFASTRNLLISAPKRLLLAAFSVFVPLLQLIRIFRHVINKRRWGQQLIKALPALVIFTTTWAIGEFLGYLTGRAEASLLPDKQ